MKEVQVYRDSNDKPKRLCPYNAGLCGFAKVGDTYCIKTCANYGGINPQTDTVYCMKEDL